MARDAPAAGSPGEICPVLIGAKIPVVVVTRVDGTVTDLGAVTAGRPTVLVFCLGGWSPRCKLFLQQLQELRAHLGELGYQVVAVSPDRPGHLGETASELGLEYNLLSDSMMSAARALGIAYRVDESALERYRREGVDLEERSGEPHHMLPVPAMFVVGSDGVIRFEYVNPDEQVRPTPEMVLAAAKMTVG